MLKKSLSTLIDEFFPFKDDDGKPLFRTGQKKIITDVCDLILKEKVKYICVEGPTGCGKSVINYVILRVIYHDTQKRTVCMTSQKMLQDQIVSEKWDFLRSVKGLSGYSCNFVNDTGSIQYKASYDGDVEMCNNSVSPKFALSGEQISESINKVIHDEPKEVVPYKTSFSGSVDFDKNMRQIIQNTRKKCEEQLALSKEDREPAFYNIDIYSDEQYEAFVYKYSYKGVTCRLKNIECPAISSKTLAEMAEIRVLNPDIFFWLNRNPKSSYQYSSAIVIDEGHTFDSVMQRIFSYNVPVHIINEITGFDMTQFCNNKDNEYENALNFKNFCSNELLWFLSFLKLINHYSTIMAIHDRESYDASNIRSDAFNDLNHGFNQYYRVPSNSDIHFSVLSILIECVINKSSVRLYLVKKYGDDDFENGVIDCFDRFITRAKEVYQEILIELGISGDKNLLDIRKYVIAVEKYLGRDRIGKMIEKVTDEKIKSKLFKASLETVSKDYIFTDTLLWCHKILSDIEVSIRLMTPVESDVPLFILNNENANMVISCKGTKLKNEAVFRYKRGKHSNIDIISINPGLLSKINFYDKTNHVIITTGTWVFPESQMRVLGINPKEATFLKIPSTFSKDRRPVYVMKDRGLTNYSEKLRDPIPGIRYTYETEEGKRKSGREVCELVDKIRHFIKEKHGENPNILIHCNSFKIALIIAQYGTNVDKRYIIHTGNPMGGHITNIISKKSIRMFPKEELLIMIKRTPNKGLVVISPSISEGIDLKGDIARAQIIMKHPIPYLGDKYIKAHVYGLESFGIPRDNTFMDRSTYMMILQQYGRIMRSEDDWGYTFVLDQQSVNSLSRIMSRSSKRLRKDMNIEYFLEAIKHNVLSNGKVQFVTPF